MPRQVQRVDEDRLETRSFSRFIGISKATPQNFQLYSVGIGMLGEKWAKLCIRKLNLVAR